ncbi:hypothetical protein BHF71_06270 [Vulcanibacillus modesticaldus]|uniref:Haloacid dehalogenase n=1 Tax=Vulcanibacillus modesticaldus TaxID=337097 RepID=A0A1D2YWU6_9BACI|nr:HAD-IB family hydrolase [Vulcanibacillus modesticaldus]OEG00126.1 hypothetical protein BHF71_06270 [Vulcanibacillus modesticaldus]
MKIIAVDFDGTLYEGNSMKGTVKATKENFTLKDWWTISKGVLKGAIVAFHKGKNGFKIEFFKAFAMTFKGKHQNEIAEYFNALAEESVLEINQQLLKKIKEYINNGDKVIILSASLQPFLQTLVARLGLDLAAIGSKLVFDERGICTGEIGMINQGENKVNQLRKWITENGYENQELWAYADSESDIPLFEYVQHPVVVNPSNEMKDIAKKRGWELFKS